MKHITVLAGVALVTLGVANANAADMRMPMQMKAMPAPMMQRVFSWTGFYAGVNGGYAWGNATSTVTLVPGGAGTVTDSSSGLFGGGQIGYNWQMGQIVFGAEADIQASAATGSFTGLTAGGVAIAGTSRTPWFGTVRGRLGYAFDRWMVYATGGALYGENTISGTLTPGGTFSASATSWSWTLGGGVEAALWDRWSVKGEYLYAATPNNLPVPAASATVTSRSDTHLVRAGLNYRF